MVEVEHHLLEFPLRHLAVADANTCLWYEFRQSFRNSRDVFDSVMDELDLPTAFNFPQAGFANQAVIPFGNKCLYRKPLRRRGRNQ